MVADGADNVAVYTPVFRHLGLQRSLADILVFTVARRPVVAGTLERTSHLTVPILYIVIGIALLATTIRL